MKNVQVNHLAHEANFRPRSPFFPFDGGNVNPWEYKLEGKRWEKWWLCYYPKKSVKGRGRLKSGLYLLGRFKTRSPQRARELRSFMEPVEHLAPAPSVTKAENATEQRIDGGEKYK
ncbi:MAG: hypothetical protein ACLQUW_13085 [Desulfobaccales bacterium]